MSKRNTTIIEVAREAGVSTATVSRVLNGGAVSLASKELVEAAVAKLHYRRNDLARGLVTGKTGVIGLLIPDVTGPLYAHMARGLEDVLQPRGMHYLVVSDDRSIQQERRSIELLLARRVDALVLVGSQLDPPVLARLLRGGPSAVLVQPEWNEDVDEFTVVRLDNRAGLEGAVDHLLGLGHVQIAHIAGVRRDGRDRRQGLLDLLARRGLEPGPFLESDSLESGGFQAGLELLKSSTASAVICTNDRVAVGFYRAAATVGARIPHDASVVGFDDLAWSAYLQPSLTTVRQPAREMGRAAAELALAGLAGTREVRHLTVPAQLVIRESTAGPRAREGVRA